jgi:DUF4097 and DUF4098 domain-containing protein YvlB
MNWPAPTSTAVVRISTTSGAVNVVAEPGRSEIGSNRELIEVSPATIDAGSHRVDCRVPEGTDLVIGSTSGRVRVEGRVGSVSVLTTSGRISIQHAVTVDARSKSGRIEITRADGECRVVNGSGRVEIVRCGPADVTSTSGRLSIGEANGEVRARGTSGRIEMTLTGAHDVDAETLSGRIEIVLPAAVRPQIVASASAVDPGVGDCVVVARSTSGRVVVTNG